MKLLLISENHTNRENNRIILGLFTRLSKYFDLTIYGPIYGDGENIYNEFYNPNLKLGLSFDDIVNELKPDIILVNITGFSSSNWSMIGIQNNNTPVIGTNGDYYSYDLSKCYNRNRSFDVLDWYHRNKVNLIMLSNYTEHSKDYPVKTVWVPRSANEKEFFVDENIERRNSICFAGSISRDCDYYDIRNKALFNLNEAGLLARKTKGRIGSVKYPSYLRKYVGALSCAGGYLHTPLAKTFEIMLSGTALMSNWMHNEDLLFGGELCYFNYDDDCSNVVEIGKKILNDKDLVKEVTSNAVKCVKENHTHKKRAEEIYNILMAVYDGNKIPKKWGI